MMRFSVMVYKWNIKFILEKSFIKIKKQGTGFPAVSLGYALIDGCGKALMDASKKGFISII